MTQYKRLTSETALMDYIKSLEQKIDAQATKGSGDIIVTDPDTGVETYLGTLPDGSVGLEQFVGDTTPPPVATTPYVSAQPGNFVVTWDGLFVAGADMPRDFVHVNVIGHKMAVDGVTTLISLPVGVIRTVTESVLVTLDVAAGGESWQFSLEAEDYSGNKAAESARTASVLMIDSISSTDQAWLDLNTEVAGKGRTFTQSVAPPVEERLPQNLWIDTSAGPGLYITRYWDGTAGQWLALKDKDAQTAQITADSKGITIYNDTAPGVSAQLPQNLWVDTTGGINIQKRWLPGSGWVVISDSRIASNSAAVTAADGKAQNALDTATAKGRTYTQATTPPVDARLPQNLWIDTSAGAGLYVTKYWDATANAGAGNWVALKDKDAQAAQVTADSKGITIYSSSAPAVSAQLPQNLWIDTTGGINIQKRWDSTTGWTVVADSRIASTSAAVTAADGKAQTALDTANSKGITIYSSSTPAVSAQLPQNLWVDTTNGNNIQKRWDSTLGWIVVSDSRIAANSAAVTAAQASANGKNKVHYATTAATGTTDPTDGNRPFIDGDTWFQRSTVTPFNIIGQWEYVTGASNPGPWVPRKVDGQVLANLDAGTITVGFLSGQNLSATAVDGKTITGALIQTTNTPVSGASARGIKLTPTELMGFDGVGNKNFSLTSAGALTLIGAIKSGSTIEGASLAAGGGGIVTSTSANVGVKVTDTGIKAYSGGNLTFNLDSTTGMLEVPGIKTNSLKGDVLTANTVTVDKLLVMSLDNLISEPTFAAGGAAWANTGAFSIDPTGARNGGPAWKIANAASQQGAYNKPQWLPTEEGQSYRMVAYVKSDVAIPVNSVSLYVTTKDAAGVVSTSGVGKSGVAGQDITGTIPANTWTRIVGVRTMPAGAVAVEFGVFKESNLATGSLWVDYVAATRMASSQLIVDGSIDGKTITGALVQTEAAASRGIKLTNTELAGYDGVGSKNFSLTSAGALTLKGTIQSGSSIQGASLAAGGGGIETSTSANTGVKLQNSGIKAYDGTNLTFSVDAATGIVDAPGIRTNSLSGDKVIAKSLTADKLVITSTDNLIMEADFSNLGKSWVLSANNTINATAGRGGLAAMRITGTTTPVTSLNMNSTALNINNKIAIDAGARFRGSMWVKSSAAAASGVYKIVGRFYTTATAFTDIVIASNPAMLANTWTNVDGIVPATIPVGTIAAEFYLSMQNAAAGTTTDIDFASVTRASDGKLIVDGAIDGKTITGATIQTAPSGARIVLDQNSLNAWNTAGDNYFNLSDATGVNISSKGRAGYSLSRANYCTNPSMEAGITGWLASGTQAVSVDTSQSFVGLSSLKVTNTATADRVVYRLETQPSVSNVRFSVYVRHNAAAAKTVQAKLHYVDGANTPLATYSGTSTSVPSNTWTRLSVVGTSGGPSGTANMRLEIVGTSFASTEILYVDAAMVEETFAALPALGAYFDGSSATTSTMTYSWDGAAGLSTSYEQLFNDVKIKTGGNSVVVPNSGASNLAPGVGFIPTLPFTQTAGLFSSDGQTISLVEGGNDPQVARIDVGGEDVNISTPVGGFIVNSKGNTSITSNMGDVSLLGATVHINGREVGTVPHWTTGTYIQAGVAPNTLVTPGQPPADSALSTDTTLISFPTAGLLTFRDAGIYSVAVQVRHPTTMGGTGSMGFVSLESTAGGNTPLYAKGIIAYGDNQSNADVSNYKASAGEQMRVYAIQRTSTTQTLYWRISVTRIG